MRISATSARSSGADSNMSASSASRATRCEHKGHGMLAPSPDSGLAATKDLRTVPVYFSMVVWGEAFVNFFLEFCLPTLLAPNNIPAIRHRAGSRFVLHTHESDLPVIERS